MLGIWERNIRNYSQACTPRDSQACTPRGSRSLIIKEKSIMDTVFGH